ncbi:MAG TPA: transketolase, partial [Alcanivorax sp.]|nr:transketolase [Alcanivorax sp.]
AAEALGAAGKNVRVVSMPSVDAFLSQSRDYQEAVLPAAVRARVAVEAGITDYWYRFTGLDGKIVGMTGFGASAPAGDLYKHFNITAEAVQAAVESVI